MRHTGAILGASFWLLLGCSSTVRLDDASLEAGAADATADGARDDHAMLIDAVDEAQLDASNDAGADVAPIDVRADVSPREAGFFDDIPFDELNSYCNDLLPAIPVIATMHDEEVPMNLARGIVPDGLYRSIRSDTYQTDPGQIPVVLLGFTLRVHDGTIQIARIVNSRPDLRNAVVQRYTCAGVSPTGSGTDLCRYTCPSEGAGILAFAQWEMRGRDLVISGGRDITYLERVDEP